MHWGQTVLSVLWVRPQCEVPYKRGLRSWEKTEKPLNWKISEQLKGLGAQDAELERKLFLMWLSACFQVWSRSGKF